MKCREFIDFIYGYLEDELPEEQRAEFDRHMGMCPACIHYLKSYEETIRLEKTLCCGPGDTLPEDVPEDLVQAILEAKKKSGERPPPAAGS